MDFQEFKFPESLNWTESPVEAARRVLPVDSDLDEITALVVGLMVGHQPDNPGMGKKRLYSASNSEDMDLPEWDETRFNPEAWTYRNDDGTETEITEKQVLSRIKAEVESREGHDKEARRWLFDLSRKDFYFEGLVCFHEGALREFAFGGPDRWVDVITFRSFDEGGSPTLFFYIA